MYRKLDEEHYVENTFLAQLLGLGWKVYKQNRGDPQDIREITVSYTHLDVYKRQVNPYLIWLKR